MHTYIQVVWRFLYGKMLRNMNSSHTYTHTHIHTYRWYGVFSMAKCFAIGIALGTLTSPEPNSGFLFATYAVDLGVQFWFRPQVDIYANASELYTAAVQVCMYACYLCV